MFDSMQGSYGSCYPYTQDEQTDLYSYYYPNGWCNYQSGYDSTYYSDDSYDYNRDCWRKDQWCSQPTPKPACYDDTKNDCGYCKRCVKENSKRCWKDKEDKDDSYDNNCNNKRKSCGCDKKKYRSNTTCSNGSTCPCSSNGSNDLAQEGCNVYLDNTNKYNHMFGKPNCKGRYYWGR